MHTLYADHYNKINVILATTAYAAHLIAREQAFIRVGLREINSPFPVFPEKR